MHPSEPSTCLSRELRNQWLCHLLHAHRVHDARQCSSHQSSHCHVQVRDGVISRYSKSNFCFSNTFDRLQTDTDCIWKFQRYSLVTYHLSRSCLPPPLIIGSHLYRLALYLAARLGRSDWLKSKYIEHRDKMKLSKEERLAPADRSMVCASRDHHRSTLDQKHRIDRRCARK